MSKRIRIITIAMMLIAVLSLNVAVATGTTESEDDKILIGGVPTYLDRFDSFLLYSRGMEEKLTELGVDYEYVLRAPPGGFADHQGQRAIFEDMLALGVDMIMTLPTSNETQHESFRIIVDEYDTPLVVTDFLAYAPNLQPPENDDLVRFASYRHSDMGKAVADYVAANYPRGTKMAMIKGLPGLISEERASDALHLANGMNIVYEHYADFNREKAYEAAQNLLAARDDVKLILGMNSTMAIGIVRAVEEAGLIGQVDVIGFGGIIEELEAVAAGRMKATAGRNHFAVGEFMADLVIAYRDGTYDQMPKTFAAPINVYDSAQAIADQIDPRYFDMFSDSLLEMIGQK